MSSYLTSWQMKSKRTEINQKRTLICTYLSCPLVKQQKTRMSCSLDIAGPMNYVRQKKISILGVMVLLVQFPSSAEPPRGNIVTQFTITCSIFHTLRLIFPFHCCGQFRLLLFILLYPTGVSGLTDAGIILWCPLCCPLILSRTCVPRNELGKWIFLIELLHKYNCLAFEL